VKFYIESLGCAKNQVESEIMMASLISAGLEAAPDAEAADIIIVNSCGFIEAAKRESINTVIELRRLYPQKKIMLAGCLALRYADELRESLTEADAVYASLDSAGIAGQLPVAEKKPETGNRPLLSLPGSAYIKVSDGCDNRCSFCAIPLIRGSLRSRPVEDAAAECAGFLRRGIKEICLVAQDLAAYGFDIAGKSLLAALLARISALDGDFWVRLLYLHPDHFPLDILPAMQNDPRILPYFDIPFQHASEGILQAMNRRGNAAQYLSLLDKIRAALPQAVFRTTFLTGFPGETDTDFKALLDFQRKAEFDWLGVFTYSREDGTPAALLQNAVPKKTALSRKAALEKTQVPITQSKLQKLTGANAAVLIEEEIEGLPSVYKKRESGLLPKKLYTGRLAINAPEVDGASLIYSESPLGIGEFAHGKITGISGFDIIAECG
jgi:ribosomal protein S12 methylthiotransferase